MTVITYLFIALVLLMLNEYRLIKKYINVIENKQGLFQSVMKPIVKISGSFKNWVHHNILHNELNY